MHAMVVTTLAQNGEAVQGMILAASTAMGISAVLARAAWHQWRQIHRARNSRRSRTAR